MPSFTVHVPRDGDDAGDRAARTAFVRDGFSLAGFLFGPLYLLRHRAYVAAAVWIIVALGGGWLCHVLRLPVAADIALAVLLALFTGLEGASLRVAALDAGGYPMADVVEAAGLQDGERAFFRAASVSGLPARTTVVGARPPAAVAPDEPVIGFFPDPGARR